MAGYFQTLMQNYGPDANAPAPTMPIHVAPAPEGDPSMDPPAAPTTQRTERPPDRPPLAAGDDFDSPPERGLPDPSFEPIDFEKEPDAAQPTADVEAPARIERVTERIVERLQDHSADEPDAAPVQVDASVTNLHETTQTDVHVTETHVHEEISHIETVELPATAEAPADPKMQEPAADRSLGNQDTMLEQLEAHLAKAFANIQQPDATPPLAIVDTADFEPADDLQPARTDPEIVREVTREVVTEIHHHHETRTEAPAKRAPRTAAEASQIGRIRFNSPWDYGGGF